MYYRYNGLNRDGISGWARARLNTARIERRFISRRLSLSDFRPAFWLACSSFLGLASQADVLLVEVVNVLA